MDWVIFLFGSGAAYFLGIAAVLASVAGFAFVRRGWAVVISTLIAVVGLILIAVSSTPLPYWLYAVAGAVTVTWLVAERSRRPWLLARRRHLRLAAASIWLIAAAVELPCQFTPTLPATGRPKLFILGDSITAGIKVHEETWSRVLARTRSIDMADFSHVGATANSGLKMASHLPPEGGLILVELGGNDLLGSTPSAEFETALNQLLERICVPGRTVMMFELPLPPFQNEFGRIQRQLAARYGVLLIPKRILIGILTEDGTTVDGIHLTPAGHERMADVVWGVIRGAYGE
jgi:acyl-CoA thioesterase-1